MWSQDLRDSERSAGETPWSRAAFGVRQPVTPRFETRSRKSQTFQRAPKHWADNVFYLISDEEQPQQNPKKGMKWEQEGKERERRAAVNKLLWRERVKDKFDDAVDRSPRRLLETSSALRSRNRRVYIPEVRRRGESEAEIKSAEAIKATEAIEDTADILRVFIVVGVTRYKPADPGDSASHSAKMSIHE
ncbi:hypothetical protein EYF80_014619 [Liparis tanakae]|uniref:Uncharacterized protein n=1 Tax=Liparis tanakae TaxID=230148 RepID=A0A4Z2IAW6_9TELE|nr:hypothetical protein EYF80_014619 [Liparis tanakae]